MYSIVGNDKKTFGEGIGITYSHTTGLSTNQRSYILRTRPCQATTPNGREWDCNRTRQAVKSGPRPQLDGPHPIYEG